ncbi:hypothetical protein KORDIASMS9_03840 [Kordia sp. SMS9]|uniref:hypothetical protein n=1 Tax=Kordia sp. SMS9 TaxID=2282170 RepID=UPI000E0D21D6|nr:hypothetical protein [Kordia sp. SMS9]AXG71583.1 hypothetical protein KORDIASMS9_03840 [Kordia sp. SMS9]
MIRIFKEFRKKLLPKSKFAKYISYAIGEIVLVVIGIVIALQIDGWKAQQETYQHESNILENLYRDLTATKKELLRDIKANQQSKENLELALQHLDNKTAYTTAMDTLFPAIANWESPLPTFTTYEIFKTEGIRIIRSKIIKDGVIKLHESTLGFIINDYDKAEWALFESVTLPFITKNLSYADQNGTVSLQPNNYTKLSQQSEFRNILTLAIALRSKGLVFYDASVRELDILLQLIQREIEENHSH